MLPDEIAPDRNAHQEQTRRLVGAMMKLTGRTATGLARAAGLTPSTINRFMHHQVRHTLSQRTMLALMTETFSAIKDKPTEELDTDALTALAPAVAVYERGILEQAPDVERALAQVKLAAADPIRGAGPTQSAGLPVLLTNTRGVNVQERSFAKAPLTTQRPPFLGDDPQAFALLMDKDSMRPRYDAGDMLYVSPARDLDGGKVDVALEYRAGGFAIASLHAISSTQLRIATLSPRARMTIDRTKLRGFYRIVGVQRLGG